MGDSRTENLLYFLAGAAIGAAVGILYAPYSGTETRRRLSDKADEGQQALLERSRELYSRGRQIAGEAAEMVEQGRMAVEKGQSLL